jgi:geranylgeranyl pyrophosphate synthase
LDNTNQNNWKEDIQREINSVWTKNRLSSAFTKDLTDVLYSMPLFSKPDKAASFYPLLPILCCYSLGGKPKNAIPIAAAFSLLHLAAHLFDTIEDNDFDGVLSNKYEEKYLLNYSTTFIFTALYVLDNLEYTGVKQKQAGIIRKLFKKTALKMCEGQFEDFKSTPSTISKAWNLVKIKSGYPFRTCCLSGAIVSGEPNNQRIKLLGDLGFELGIIIQIGDDLNDLLDQKSDFGNVKKYMHSIPLAFALNHLKRKQSARLLEMVKNNNGPDDDKLVKELIIESGALVYSKLEQSKRRIKAEDYLCMAKLSQKDAEIFLRFMSMLVGY